MSLNQTTLALCEIQDYLNTRLKHAQAERWDRELDNAVMVLTAGEAFAVTVDVAGQESDNAGREG